PTENIQNRHQIKPALSGQHASGITHPDLIGPLHAEVLDPVGCDRSAMATVGRSDSILGALPSKEALLAHDAGDAIAPSGTAQRMSQTWAAIVSTAPN